MKRGTRGKDTVRFTSNEPPIFAARSRGVVASRRLGAKENVGRTKCSETDISKKLEHRKPRLQGNSGEIRGVKAGKRKRGDLPVAYLEENVTLASLGDENLAGPHQIRRV